MAALTNAEILESIDNAIRAWSSPSTADDCNGVASLSVGGRSYTRTDLPALLKVRDKYVALVASASRGPIRGGLPRVSA